ncbi:hypothetical protein TNCV_3864881 [Trichonephila clavipes]|nr:hypothetical protein TNCV_3864881 [Trichonephila clavipes]
MDIPQTRLKIDHKTLNQRLKRTIPNILKEKIKITFICGDSSHYARDCEKRFKPKESNDHIHNRKNVNTLKVESEKQNSDEFANLQYILLWSPWKYRCGQRTVRLAGYSIQWLSTTPRSLRAQAQQIQTRTETMGLLRIRKREKAKKERRRCASRRYRPHTMELYLLE